MTKKLLDILLLINHLLSIPIFFILCYAVSEAINMSTMFSHTKITTTKQFSKNDLDIILSVSRKMESNLFSGKLNPLLRGKIMASLFYEPSTRTRISFESAMKRLGGEVITAVGIQFSSFDKGETIHDTIKIIGQYTDVIVMRHPKTGSAKIAAEATDKPFINAGDGANQHPTQALLDLYTIKKEKGHIDELTIAMIGDLKYGRTVHSLSYLLGHYNVKIICVSPNELKMPNKVTSYLKEKKIDFEETDDLKKAFKEADVVYDTRIQKERFPDKSEYEKLKNVYVIDKKLVQSGKKDITIMHPLPRVGEIKKEVDNLEKNAAYFRQAENGVYVRMALLSLVSKAL